MADRPLVLAHRGASRVAPENTIEAFAAARELGADGVELDVRRTADDVLVVHHDPDVEGFGMIARHSFEALRVAQPHVPTLDEVLAACIGLLVNAEVKCLPWEPDADGADRPVMRAVTTALRAHAPGAIVSSFDLGAVDACRAFAPELTTAWLTSGQDIASASAIAVAHGHTWLHPDRGSALRDLGPGIRAAHDSGLRVDVWTVDDPEEMRALAEAGVDAVVTNVPDIALAVLR